MLHDNTSEPTVEALSDISAETNGIDFFSFSVAMDRMRSCWVLTYQETSAKTLAGCFCLGFSNREELSKRKVTPRAREIFFLLRGIGVLETTLHPCRR
jgi:hypothetical protein